MDYSQFLFAMLLKDITTKEYADMTYDRLYDVSLELYALYTDSPYCNNGGSGDQCMAAFLEHYFFDGDAEIEAYLDAIENKSFYQLSDEFGGM